MEKKYGHNILELGHTIRRHIDYSFSLKNLTGQQARVLRVIYMKSLDGDVTQKDIETFFGVRRSTMTHTLHALENSEYIIRKMSDDDARKKMVIITEKGIEASEYGKRVIDETDQMIKSVMTDEELEMFTEMTKKIKNIFNERSKNND